MGHCNHLGDGLEGVGLGQPLRHHRGEVAARLAERVRQQGKWFFQSEHDGLIVRRRQFIGVAEQGLAKRIALAPALDGSDAVPREHFLTIVPGQSVAQRQRPALAVIFGHMAGQHLRLRLVGAVDAVQCVKDHKPVVARDVRGSPDRVEDRRVRLRDEFQHTLIRGTGDTGCSEVRGDSGGTGQECAAMHRVSLIPEWR